ncbi:hypothetical protein BLOT_004408 [Blomia tropicalis]|nr:hypothetical protein BLOT_004408 [Blomia tropicalis]
MSNIYYLFTIGHHHRMRFCLLFFYYLTTLYYITDVLLCVSASGDVTFALNCIHLLFDLI